MDLFITQLWQNPKTFFLTALVVVFSICLHEYFHAQCALWMGDSTAADRGHLTLNPFRQMGFFSLLMFLFVGFAWGAVPVNPALLRARHKIWGPLSVSLAGPAANLFLAFCGWIAFFLLFRIPVENHSAWENLMLLAFFLGLYNIILLIFNLIPAPGLDGWGVVQAVFPQVNRVSSEVVKGVMVFLIFSAVLGVRYLFEFAAWIMLLARP